MCVCVGECVFVCVGVCVFLSHLRASVVREGHRRAFCDQSTCSALLLVLPCKHDGHGDDSMVIVMMVIVKIKVMVMVTWCLATCEDGRHPNCLVLKRLEERHFIKKNSSSFITKINR